MSINNPYFWLVIVVYLWSLPWKGVALWRSARNRDLGWFIVLLLVNSLAIIEIVYIFAFSKKNHSIERNKYV